MGDKFLQGGGKRAQAAREEGALLLHPQAKNA